MKKIDECISEYIREKIRKVLDDTTLICYLTIVVYTSSQNRVDIFFQITIVCKDDEGDEYIPRVLKCEYSFSSKKFIIEYAGKELKTLSKLGIKEDNEVREALKEIKGILDTECNAESLLSAKTLLEVVKLKTINSIGYEF